MVLNNEHSRRSHYRHCSSDIPVKNRLIYSIACISTAMKGHLTAK